MADYREYITGKSSGVATAVFAGTAPQMLSTADEARISLVVQPDGLGLVGHVASFSASVGRICSVPSGGVFEETNYRGEVWGRSEGATVAFHVWQV
jgi:hypothetical protein